LGLVGSVLMRQMSAREAALTCQRDRAQLKREGVTSHSLKLKEISRVKGQRGD